MTLKLFGAALSPYVRKTRAFMQEKDIPFEIVHVDPANLPEDFGLRNPLRRIPVLEHDGMNIADSAVICQYLEKTYPNTPLYPSAPQDFARTLWFEKFADYELGATCTFGVFRNRVIMPLRGATCDEARVGKALEKLPGLFDYLESQLKDRQYLVGERLTVADIALASQLMNLGHGGEKVDSTRWPALCAHMERMHARPTFAHALEKERPFVEKVRAANRPSSTTVD